MNSAARRLRSRGLALAASLLALLAACAPLPPRAARRSILLAQELHTALAEHDWSRAQRLAVRLHATAPADSPIAARALVREAWAELLAGRPRPARRLLVGPEALALPPGRLDRAAWTFLEGRIERRPRAVRALASALPSPPAALVSASLAFRARLAWALENPVAAVRLLVARRRLLPHGAARGDNDRLLWRDLRRWVEKHGALRRPAAAGATTDGWIALADLDLSAGADPPLLRRLLTRWEARYPHHPARRTIVPHLLARLNLLTRYPSKVAVLLPRRGPYRDAARAVAGGILAARFAAGGEGRGPNVRFFDTGTGRSGALDAYADARRWGAAIVIGPLLAPQVLALARAVRGHVTILALNDLPHGTPVPSRFYQFGISPEDEAQEDARRALRHGRRIAGALVPRNAWGARVLAAFRRAYEGGGGILAAVAFYRPGRHDYAGTVRSLLRVDASIVRARTLESVLGRPLTFEPVARQDLEMIFMPARTEDARELRPELRYFGALGIPVYALAEVDEPGVVHRDLDGIRFPDMPWLLGRDPALAPVRTEVARLWPALARRDGRLFALGYDAYRLVPLLLHSRHPLRNPYPGATGLLYLGRGGVIHRRLDWAVFRDGRPVPIPPSRSLSSSSPIPSPS